jgi:hypothetical protein
MVDRTLKHATYRSPILPIPAVLCTGPQWQRTSVFFVAFSSTCTVHSTLSHGFILRVGSFSIGAPMKLAMKRKKTEEEIGKEKQSTEAIFAEPAAGQPKKKKKKKFKKSV